MNLAYNQIPSDSPLAKGKNYVSPFGKGGLRGIFELYSNLCPINYQRTFQFKGLIPYSRCYIIYFWMQDTRFRISKHSWHCKK
jgi:hypothetical protein